jgi:hypothetical protein
MSGGEEKPAGPVIRYAPLGELRVYAVYEHELEILAHGSPASLYLNFALALLSIFATSLVALVTTPIPAGHLYQAFFIICTVTLIIGGILLVLWWREHSSAKTLIQRIKNRMPPPEGIRESP